MPQPIIEQLSCSEALLERLHTLQYQAKSHGWRGLVFLQTASDTLLQWPEHALVLDTDINQYRQHLGTSNALLVLDMRASMHADAIAACLPTVHAGGLAILVMPKTLPLFAQRLASLLPNTFAQHIVLAPASSNATHSNQALVDLRRLALTPLPRALITQPNQLNPEQLELLNLLRTHIETKRKAPALINAPRGRGKSTVLGILAAQLIQQGYSVAISAPSRRQAETLQTSAGQALRFVAPDALLANSEPADVIILDEAASLPIHMLNALLARYPTLIMATTSEGYETCGRGFLLRFQQRLQREFSNYLQASLQQAVRFAPNCPVEAWLHHALLLNPHTSQVVSEPAQPTPRLKQLSYLETHASKLDENWLQQCFFLLMDAHYQTSANDLKLLLDDAKHRLIVQHDGSQVIGVTWLCREGGLSHQLAVEVVAGTRRPTGNLLAQGLAYYFQHVAAAQAQWLRVVRIAVAPNLQNRGLGRQLLKHLIANAPPDITAIGTSFASTPSINRFWRRANFLPVRLGARKDAATGCHALVMLYPIEQAWQHELTRWTKFWHAEVSSFQLLYQLPSKLFTALEPLPEVTESDYRRWAKQRIRAFTQHQLEFALVRTTLITLFAEHLATHDLLKHMALNLPLTEQIKDTYQVTGRKDSIERIREVCFRLLTTI